MARPYALALLVGLSACSALDLFSADAVDDPGCARPRAFFRDADGDGYGAAEVTAPACARPAGFAARSGDCDDARADVHPGAIERCDRVDNDCSRGGGDDLSEDADGDGHAPPGAACALGLPRDDCDDTRDDVHPGAPERCDGRDTNCAGGVDEAPAADLSCGGDGVRASVCRRGACLATCALDRGDCDGDRANGCEADLAGDATHCGACGTSCGAGSPCVGGRCLSRISALAAGAAAATDGAGRASSFTCAVRGGDGDATPRLLCWGTNRDGQLNVAPGYLAASRTPVLTVLPLPLRDERLALGARGGCVAGDDPTSDRGVAWCWGTRRDGVFEGIHRVLDAHDIGAVAMAAGADGRDAACMITRGDRRLLCWGSNASGNLGLGATAYAFAPTEVPFGGRFDDVAMGPGHTCAVSDRSVYCWGRNDAGQLGDGTRAPRAGASATPAFRAPPAADAVRPFVGRDFSCATATGLTDARRWWTLSCWGANLGNWFRAQGAPAAVTAPVLVASSADARADFAAGGARWCAREGEAPRCAGELFVRDGARAFQDLAPVPSLAGVTRLALGPDHAYGLRGPSDVLCWGDNAAGQCGDGSTSLRRAPVLVAALRAKARVVAASRDFVRLTPDGAVGSRSPALASLFAGQPVRDLALDDRGGACAARFDGALACTTGSFAADSLDGPARQVAVARDGPDGAGRVVCARAATGRVRCFRPYVRVVPPAGTEYLADGPSLDAAGLAGSPFGAHFCAWDERGEVRCWGDNAAGQADPARRGEATPEAARVEGLDDVVEVAVGPRLSCARRVTGAAVCWGETRLAAATDAPLTDVPDVADVTGLALGAEHACVLRRSGRVACWGANGYGQLGDGTTLDRDAPVEARGLDDAEAVFAGASYTCARRRTGQVLCWGRNDEGQLDDGTLDDRSAPTPTLQAP